MINHIRELRLRATIDEREKSYGQFLTSEASLAEQLRLFNRCWPAIRKNVPYYRDLADSFKLPEIFQSWTQIIDSFPIINRGIIQQNRELLVDGTKPPQRYRITGGSTAQPVQLAAWKSESAYTTPDMWFGRSWYGIRPSDKLFMIWGHSHLLGTGWRGRYNACAREIKNSMLGYFNFSAYNMEEQRMREAADRLISFRPQYMIGYSVALDAFARANVDRSAMLSKIGLKAIIGAAEGFPSDNSAEKIQRLLNAPVAMEYGSVETDLIAHTHPEGGYKVFWKTYFVEAMEDAASGGKVIRVTSLYPRCFPLIRYEIGDEIELYEAYGQIGIRRFKRVLGRCNDYLSMPDGSRMHSELITHAVRSYHEITGYQAVQNGSDIRIYVLASADLDPSIVQGIRTRLGKMHPSLTRIHIERAQKLHQTIAGKTPIVVRNASQSVP